MRIREGFELREVGDEHIVISIGDAVACFNGMIKLNSTGTFLWKKMEQDIDINKLISDFAVEYSIDESMAENDIKAFLNSLSATKCIIE